MEKLEHFEYLIVDEFFFMGAHKLTRLRKAVPETCKWVCFGDPFQLTPVQDEPVYRVMKDVEYSVLRDFILSFGVMQLTTNFRQKGDRVFTEFLIRMRTRSCSLADITSLQARKLEQEIGSILYSGTYVYLGFSNLEVNNVNQRVQGYASRKFKIDTHSDKWCRNVVPFRMDLWIGCHVMLLVNIDLSEGLVNGRVVGYGADVETIDIKFDGLSSVYTLERMQCEHKE